MSEHDTQKHTLHLRTGDMDFLKETLPRGQASRAIRKIVSNFVDRVKNAEQSKIPPAPTDL